ncbi:hypothetical protein J3R83DRAFT_2639 [Lanmaoa asiatica]|nr:hypothetical protein J3R83DRAFT_2639 [Lanmaoa asiatica]
MANTATDPTLSPQRPQVNRLEHALKCTPQSRGSATISEHISTIGVHVSDIRPWITKDVENSQKCSFDKLLKDFLANCSDEPQDSTRLFEECLEKVLPICNGEAQVNNKSDIKLNSCKRENELYPLFVTAANVALLYLRDLKIDGLRPAKDDDSSICFHVHDPLTLTQSHQGQLSERKPDVVIVSQSDAYNANASEGQILFWQDMLLTVLTKAPEKSLDWRNVRTFVEFKRTMKKMAVPPDRYTVKAITPPQQHEYLSADDSNDEIEPEVLRAQPPPSESGEYIFSRFTPWGSFSVLVRQSARQLEKAAATISDSRKRTSEQLGPSESQSKRQKSEPTKSHPAIVQAGYYAAEMFAAYAARQHVVGLVIVGDVLYVWWYDRQGTIQCSGLNFIEDLPRLLVLLLAMQRFEAKHWGLNPHVDPKFGLRLPRSQKTTLRGNEGKEIQVIFELSDSTRVTHFGLNGRATNVLPVECKDLSEDSDLVAKIFWMEVLRMSEPEILKKVREIAETDPDVKGHVPEMLWFKKFDDTSTEQIRERLGLKTEGARVLCMIIFRKLRPITELCGDQFLNAWWATVKCHRALWKGGVYHRDVSPSNLMYRMDKQKQIVAVLNDFDLASTKAIAIGTQRTGTVPFMAVELLDEIALQGDVAHLYGHDAESFIWTLIWITLRYTNGKLKGDRDRPLDTWLTVDATGCAKEKDHFLNNSKMRNRLQAGAGHEQNWELARDCIMALRMRGIAKDEAETARQKPDPDNDADTAFNTLLKDPTNRYLPVQ